MNTRELQTILRELGWPIGVDGNYGPQTQGAVFDFQRGFLLGRTIGIDGRAGPQTHQALRDSRAQGGKASPHFAYREFKSKGNGWIKVNRDLLRGLEAYRRLLGRGVTVISGYRDPRHNTRVGGARNSQHLYGNAADVRGALSVGRVRSLGIFTGIGYAASSGLVQHVDVRAGNPGAPTTWRYGR